MCASSLSVARGIKTALRSSLYTRLRWKIMIPLRKVSTSDVNKNKRQAGYIWQDARLLAFKAVHEIKRKWV